MKIFRKTISVLLAILLLFSLTAVTSVSAYATYGETDDGFAYYVTEDGTATFTDYRGNLTDVVIPEKLDGYTVTAISGSGGLEWGENVQSITLPSTITEIYGGAFSGLGVKTIKLNEGLKKIGDYAFNFCLQLENITLPESLESIGDGAFDSCRNLKSVNIPEKLTIIPDALFYSCNFESFNIPAHIRKIGSRIFTGNENFKEITVDEENPYYRSVDGVLMDKEQREILFYPPAKADTTYEVPETVKKIGEYAFIGCSSLDELALPEGLEHIGKNAFGGNGVESLTIPDSVTVIEEFAFYNCDNLETVILGNGLTKIDKNLFAYCNNLESVHIGENVEEIDYYAFEKCTSLREVLLPDSLKVIRQHAFLDCAVLENFVMPDSVTELETDVFENCKDLVSVKLSENLKVISQGTFKNCVSLRHIEIPDSVEEIQHEAFRNCISLWDVKFGSGVKVISDAFLDCPSITRITIPDNVEKLLSYSIGYTTHTNIYMGHDYAVCPWVIIYANKGTAAEKYAKENGLMFGALDGEVTPFSKGDVDGDGRITIKDATLIQKHLAKIVTLTTIQKEAADFGTPGIGITIGDATTIQKFLAGITDKLS